MNIAFAASEMTPFVKTGGLADVIGALPIAMNNPGCDIRIFIPRYSSIDLKKQNLEEENFFKSFKIKIGTKSHTIKTFRTVIPKTKISVFFVDCPYYYDRDDIYTSDRDEDERFILFNRAVLEIMQRLKWAPDLIHCHDWQAGLIPFYIKENYAWDKLFKNTKTIFTIHNIGYQGLFPMESAEKAEIHKGYTEPMGPCEFYGKFSFLKTAVCFTDKLTTVSETYAREILTEEMGGGLHEIINQRKKDLTGIINGADYKEWNPDKDPLIFQKYSLDNFREKQKNKAFLQQIMNLHQVEHIPLIGMVTRLVDQKGFDIITEAIPELMKNDILFVVLGTGEVKYQKMLVDFSKKYPKKFSVKIAYDNHLAHSIYAGSDMLLMPSLYEPCGLNQIYALKYGTIPIVRKTGGLADTVADWDENKVKSKHLGTGFVFEEYSAAELIKTVRRARNLYIDSKEWEKIIKNAMLKDFSWKKSSEKYCALFSELLGKPSKKK